jgi:signal transduction histidine kinase/PAS domain-containing protein
MSIVELAFAPWSDPRLAAQLANHATSPSPVWLWSADGSHIVWTNAVGAAVFGAADTSECAERLFEPTHPAALEIARLAATLPASGQARLERLRGFGASFGGALTCICSQVTVADDAVGVLVIGTEAAGLPLTLRERVHRLFAGCESALAVFALDGVLLFATEGGQARLGETPTSSALGIGALAAQALTSGRASGVTRYGAITIERLGADSSAVLAVTFGAETQGDEQEQEPQAADIAPMHWPAPELPAATAPDSSLHENAERRHPLRFVWQMDAEGHFVIGSDEFTELVGPRTTAVFGRLWSEIAADLKLDPEDRIARAIATHETWSGVVLSWPVEEGKEWLPVELAGLPVFDSGREFCGYRGFGICRDVVRINQLLRARHAPPAVFRVPDITSEVAAIPVAAAQSPALTQTKAAVGGSAGAEGLAESDLAAAPAASRVVPLSANVVPFPHSTATSDAIAGAATEPKAFNELAQELRARLREHSEISVADSGASPADEAAPAHDLKTPEPPASDRDAATEPEPAEIARRRALAVIEPTLLDHVPAGVLIYQRDTLIYANRHFLELSGYASIEELAAAGGLNSLFAEPDGGAGLASNGGPSLAVVTRGGVRLPVRGHLCTVPWREASALALILTESESDVPREAAVPAQRLGDSELGELNAKLDSLASKEEESLTVSREAQRAAAANADFLAKMSHEIRGPLNTITGFSEIILAERFGAVGHERYRDYLQNIHAAGLHIASALNDLLDLSKVETGQFDLAFADVDLNAVIQQCVSIMQPQASRARIIIRTSLAPKLGEVIADERALRQILLNLLSHAIKLTGPGGQAIVSTARSQAGEAVLRVRDTGIGMSAKELQSALQSFQQTTGSANLTSAGPSLGLRLTKALTEANRAHFAIESAPNAGTLVEIVFPPQPSAAK